MIGIIILGILLLVVRVIVRKNKMTNMALKPYRYQLDSRRSTWANRLGF